VTGGGKCASLIPSVSRMGMEVPMSINGGKEEETLTTFGALLCRPGHDSAATLGRSGGGGACSAQLEEEEKGGRAGRAQKA
jgi:hypothetical protein